MPETKTSRDGAHDNLEWLFRAKPEWCEIAQGVLFQRGDIVEHGEDAEEKAD